ncbi:MAG: hypothetical protein ACYS6K_29510, partial [Planctomycetota bacterium]
IFLKIGILNKKVAFFGLDLIKISISEDKMVTRIFEEFEQFSAQENGVLWYSLLLKCFSQNARIRINNTCNLYYIRHGISQKIL